MLSSCATRYLLAIYELSDGGAPVRSVDIANQLGVSRASVVKSLRGLILDGLILKEYYGSVELTPNGVRASSRIHLEYTLLYAFFNERLGLSPAAARIDAVASLCALSSESKNRFADLLLTQKAV